MNRILLTLKRPFIWLYRFRHRCGYGVHSPFAFNLITHVIYESTAYYKYEELAKAQKQLELEKDKRWKYESKKVKRLLFRLVNYTQPETIVDAGTLAASALYLKAGKEGADYTSASDLSELFLESGTIQHHSCSVRDTECFLHSDRLHCHRVLLCRSGSSVWCPPESHAADIRR